MALTLWSSALFLVGCGEGDNYGCGAPVSHKKSENTTKSDTNSTNTTTQEPAPAPSKDETDRAMLIGGWTAINDKTGEPQNWTLEFREDGSMTEHMEGKQPTTSTWQLSDGTVTFTIDKNGHAWAYSGKLEDNRIKGKFVIEGSKLSWVFAKQ